MSLDLALSTILSPIVLFFVLGLGAALLRSQMTVPEAFAKGLAIYLMMAIGLKGGVEMSKAALGIDIAILALAALALSFLLPFLAYWALRLTSRMDRLNAAATAGHYGSISIVTFVAATQALEFAGLPTSGHMVAIAALMEVPAIVSALLLRCRTGWLFGHRMGKRGGGHGENSPFLCYTFPRRIVSLPVRYGVVCGTLSLGVTFPFNLTIGIPLYILLAQLVAG